MVHPVQNIKQGIRCRWGFGSDRAGHRNILVQKGGVLELQALSEAVGVLHSGTVGRDGILVSSRSWVWSNDAEGLHELILCKAIDRVGSGQFPACPSFDH